VSRLSTDDVMQVLVGCRARLWH